MSTRAGSSGAPHRLKPFAAGAEMIQAALAAKQPLDRPGPVTRATISDDGHELDSESDPRSVKTVKPRPPADSREHDQAIRAGESRRPSQANSPIRGVDSSCLPASARQARPDSRARQGIPRSRASPGAAFRRPALFDERR